MALWEMLLISVGLAADAFAVSVCKGLKMREPNRKYTLLIALFFGGFQALMPLIGWFLGKQFESYITSVDHWISFGLLLFIGGKMIVETFKEEEEDCGCQGCDIKELFGLAIATSIDALAVGITFAFLKANVGLAVSLIGIITFALSLVGVWMGRKFGDKLGGKAELIGGIILVAIGTKILLEHLGVISF